MSTLTAITWTAADHLDADPAATIALDRDAWQQRGARFRPVDDELSGTAALATASIALDGRAVDWAVLDHGQSTTFLLVGGHADAERVLYELLAQGALAPADVLERLPASVRADHAPGQIAARLATLEHQVSDLRRTA